MLCTGFDQKRFEKGHEMYSGYLDGMTGFRVKRHCLLTDLRFTSKSKGKVKDKG